MEVTRKESVLVRQKRGSLVLLISAWIRRAPRIVLTLSFNLPGSHSWCSSSSFPDTHFTLGLAKSGSFPKGKRDGHNRGERVRLRGAMVGTSTLCNS